MTQSTYHRKRISNWIAIRVKDGDKQVRTYELDDYGRLKIPFPRQKKRVLRCPNHKCKKLPRKARLISVQVEKENDLEPTGTQDAGFSEEPNDIVDVTGAPEILALFQENTEDQQPEPPETPFFCFPKEDFEHLWEQ